MAAVKVITKGVIFDQARREGVLKAGIKAGTAKLLPRVRQVIVAKLNLQHSTGRYPAAIKMYSYPSGTGVVKASEDPIKRRKTWLETGKRGGVKTKRKGSYAWRAGKTFVKNEQKAGYYEAEIARRLNG